VTKSAPDIGKSFFSDFLYLFPVIAFYLKKLVIPFPLNFAIMKINTIFYSILFIIISVINVICLLKKKWVLPIFTFLLVISFSPSLMIALGKVAWAPMAERYLYLSLSIMGIGLTLMFKYLYEKKYISNKSLLTICILLIAVITVTTFFRLFVFNNSKTIWTATLKLNPENSMVLCMYGLAMEGKERQKAFHRAISNPKPFKWRAKALLVLGQYEMASGNYNKSLECVDEALKIQGSYKNYCSAALILLNARDQDQSLNKRHIKRALQYYKKAYARRKSVFVLYKIATLLNHSGEYAEARGIFEEIIQNHPKSKYAAYSKKHLAD